MGEQIKFWRGVFSESDGSPSFSRVATAVSLAFALGWITAIVCKHWQLPDFTGVIAFVTCLYFTNKLAGVIQSKTDRPQQ